MYTRSFTVYSSFILSHVVLLSLYTVILTNKLKFILTVNIYYFNFIRRMFSELYFNVNIFCFVLFIIPLQGI